eukprot:21307-Eustigmatos_ZCMA.PRE.1
MNRHSRAEAVKRPGAGKRGRSERGLCLCDNQCMLDRDLRSRPPGTNISGDKHLGFQFSCSLDVPLHSAYKDG